MTACVLRGSHTSAALLLSCTSALTNSFPYSFSPLPTQNLHGKDHFTSLHGKVGLLSFGLALLSPALGVLSFRRLGLIQRFPEDWQPHIKWLHRLVRPACLADWTTLPGCCWLDVAGGDYTASE